MKKGLLIASIALWSIVALAVIGVAYVGITSGFSTIFNIDNMRGELVRSEEISLDGAAVIVVEGAQQDVEIRTTDSDRVLVNQYGNRNLSEERMFLSERQDDGIYISFNRLRLSFSIGLNFADRLVVYIPQSYDNLVSVTTTSGGITLTDDLTVETLNLRAGSGGIRFNGTVYTGALEARVSSSGIRVSAPIVARGRTVFRASSGGIRADGDITARRFVARTSSGGIRAGAVNVESYEISSTSGGIRVEQLSGGGEARSTSGGVRVGLKDPVGDVVLQSTSGGIRVQLEPAQQFILHANTTSGSVRTNFPADISNRRDRATAQVGDTPNVTIYARATSGGIRVNN